VNNDYCFAW